MFSKRFRQVMTATLALAFTASAATLSPLAARGFTVIPAPQKVSLQPDNFAFTSQWRLELGPSIDQAEISVQSLKEQLRERFRLTLTTGKAMGVLRLAISPNAVTVDPTADANKPAIAEQAYRMQLAPGQITITGNTAVGLFYGVQTLVQLLKTQDGTLWLPECEIQDWPDLELRTMYWDDAHHLEHLDVLEAALKQAAFYKINGFSIKLEGHFDYQHAPAIVEPYALTSSQLQQLTDYGLKYHVQLIPYLDAPAHVAFILKHPEYAGLREYANSNYEFCATNPKTYELLEGMFQDLLAANKGGKYFILSTDEPYYVGLARNEQCQEADRAKELGSVGKLLGEFVTKTAGYLHDQGRTVIFWGEYPLKPDDVASIPSYMVNGELYGPKFDPLFSAHGIKQTIYTSTAGEEQMFPRYYSGPNGPGRLQEMFEQTSSASDTQAKLTGIFVAGWGDPGLHPETLWLGYVAGSAAGWHRTAAPSPAEIAASFFPLFYGTQNTQMGRLYQLMCEQAEFWEESWLKGPTAARTPIWGDSRGLFNPPHAAHDQYMLPLAVPSKDLLRLNLDWRSANANRLEQAAKALERNDELIDLLHANLQRVQFNRYNLEVYLSIANLYRQNLLTLQNLGRISASLQSAQDGAVKSDAKKAVAALDQALAIAESIQETRNRTLQDATATWYKSWFPRVLEANGRTFLNKVDNVKDHQPARTVDMSYLVYRELLFPLGDWASATVQARNQYAKDHGLPARDFRLNWLDTETTVHNPPLPDDSEN